MTTALTPSPPNTAFQAPLPAVFAPCPAARDRGLQPTRCGQQDAWRMIKRRAKAADIRTQIGNHTFRATGITAYLKTAASWKPRSTGRGTKARARPAHMTGGAMM